MGPHRDGVDRLSPPHRRGRPGNVSEGIGIHRHHGDRRTVPDGSVEVLGKTRPKFCRVRSQVRDTGVDQVSFTRGN